MSHFLLRQIKKKQKMSYQKSNTVMCNTFTTVFNKIYSYQFFLWVTTSLHISVIEFQGFKMMPHIWINFHNFKQFARRHSFTLPSSVYFLNLLKPKLRCHSKLLIKSIHYRQIIKAENIQVPKFVQKIKRFLVLKH